MTIEYLVLAGHAEMAEAATVLWRSMVGLPPLGDIDPVPGIEVDDLVAHTAAAYAGLLRHLLSLDLLDVLADRQRLRERVASELKTTFASHYTKVVSLAEALDVSNLAAYTKRATGEKFLINPHKAG